MTEKRVRRTFTPEYRSQAARLVIDTGRPIAQVARELELNEALLGRWVKKEREREGHGEVTGELTSGDRAELNRLRKEVLELRKDNEFLGKAAAQLPRRSLES